MNNKLRKAIDAIASNCPIQVNNHTDLTVETKRCRGDITLQCPTAATHKAIIQNSDVYLDYFDRIIVKNGKKVIKKIYIAYKDDKHTQVLDNELFLTKEKEFKQFNLAMYNEVDNPGECHMPSNGIIQLLITSDGKHEVLACTNDKRSRKAHNHY